MGHNRVISWWKDGTLAKNYVGVCCHDAVNSFHERRTYKSLSFNDSLLSITFTAPFEFLRIYSTFCVNHSSFQLHASRETVLQC